MAAHDMSLVPPPSPEHRRVAAGQFERANQVIATGNYDYGIQLLLTCCKLDPANLICRQALRQTEKTKYQNNFRGSRLALLTTAPAKALLKAAKRGRDYLKVLEHGEKVLVRNPWDTGTQLDMADAAEALHLRDLAIWTLEQARQKNAMDVTVNRALARLHEKNGTFAEAIHLWELVRKADPADVDAAHKAKDLAVRDTIARGHYEAALDHQAETGQSQAEANEPPQTGLYSGATPARTASGGSDRASDRAAHEATPLWERIKADPTNANAYLHLAGVYRKAGQLEQAREVLEQGLGPTGNRFELTIELAELEIEPFRRNLAITEERLRAQPDDEDLRRIRIRLLKEINTRELELYRQKADRYPAEKGHRFELGLRLLRARQLDAAICELQAARSDPRYQWRALLYLGHCFRKRNNWRLAQRNFAEALQCLPSTEEDTRKDILFQLAQGHAESGDLAKAIDFGTELANLDFAYRGIGHLLDDWQAQLESGKGPVGNGRSAKDGGAPVAGESSN